MSGNDESEPADSTSVDADVAGTPIGDVVADVAKVPNSDVAANAAKPPNSDAAADMRGESVADAIPLPEYEVGQYFPEDPQFEKDERRRLRSEYGWLRAFYKTRPGRHRKVQQWLNQARMGTTYDVYLTRIAVYAVGAALVGALLGVLVALWLDSMGLFAGLQSPIRVGGSLFGIGALLSENKALLGGGAVALLVAVGAGALTWVGFYQYPRVQVDGRRRNIDYNLPHAIVFMYALSQGGMNLLEVVKHLSDSEQTYGAVAEEFDMVARDVELFGNDLYTAFRNARNVTPSDGLEQFFDDMVSILESGGDATEFLADESERYFRRAQEEQEDFLETLAILSEVFIVAFVASPLFVIVILMVIGILGGDAMGPLYLLIYAVLPFGMLGYLVLISTLSAPYVSPPTTLELLSDEHGTPAPLADESEFTQYRRHRRRRELLAMARDPLGAIRERPVLTLALTVPVALLFVGSLFVTGAVSFEGGLFRSDPLGATTSLVVLPFAIVAVPLSFFHELKRGHENEVVRRFPDTLNILSSANNMGISLPDALELIAQWAGGRFGEELRRVRNDIRWNYDTAGALTALANRLNVPQVSRTVKLIAEGNQSSGDLSRVLSIAAEDTRNRYRMIRNRRRAMSSYIAVVVIGYLVFLLVIVMLDSSYLTPISQLPSGAPSLGPGAPGGFEAFPIDTYRMLFYHSVLIQGIGSGMLAGELADNDAIAGLKYSVALVALAAIVFQVF